MLGFLFGFNARLGRLHYFLSTIALAVVMTAVCFAIASYAIQNTPRGTDPSVGLIAWPVIVSILVFLWITFTLQSMRIRDIGWDPVCVIPVWIMILLVDKLVAVKFPGWSVGSGDHETIVGLLINFVLALALAFWPSGPETGSMPNPGETRRPREEPPETPRPPPPIPTMHSATPTRAEFGRRGR